MQRPPSPPLSLTHIVGGRLKFSPSSPLPDARKAEPASLPPSLPITFKKLGSPFSPVARLPPPFTGCIDAFWPFSFLPFFFFGGRKDGHQPCTTKVHLALFLSRSYAKTHVRRTSLPFFFVVPPLLSFITPGMSIRLRVMSVFLSPPLTRLSKRLAQSPIKSLSFLIDRSLGKPLSSPLLASKTKRSVLSGDFPLPQIETRAMLRATLPSLPVSNSVVLGLSLPKVSLPP